jgi:hypothetical protein
MLIPACSSRAASECELYCSPGNRSTPAYEVMENEMKTGDVVFVEESNGWGLAIRLLFREHHNVKGHAEGDGAAFRVPR